MGVGRRKRLLGKYAKDRNIEVESRYGKGWLATVEGWFNPATGVPCVQNELYGRHKADDKFHKYNIHEYRFNTSSGRRLDSRAVFGMRRRIHREDV